MTSSKMQARTSRPSGPSRTRCDRENGPKCVVIAIGYRKTRSFGFAFLLHYTRRYVLTSTARKFAWINQAVLPCMPRNNL